MILIIGGAHQGKLDCARSKGALTDGDIFICTGLQVDFSRPCVYAIEEFCYACVLEGKDPLASFREHREQWQNSILICRDIFCGVVPVDPRQRQWRRVTGELCRYLAEEADSVIRVFCGLEQRLK